jgi:hypothetical protein
MVPGRGAKTHLKGDEDVIAMQIKLHSRNLKNILTYLKEEHHIIICKKTLRIFLKSWAINGKEPDYYLLLKDKHNQDEFELKQAQIKSLEELEDSKYIDLYFGDESHFGLTPVPYARQGKENPILLPTAKGKCINVIGLMSRKMICFIQCMKQASIAKNDFIYGQVR